MSENIKDATDYISELRQHWSEISDLSNFVLKSIPGVVQYEMEGGIGIGIGFIKIPEIAIQRVFMPGNTRFKEHRHPPGITEIIYVISGAYSLEYEIKNGWKKQEQRQGDTVVFAPEQLHKGSIHENTLIWSITIPGDLEGYPNGAG